MILLLDGSGKWAQAARSAAWKESADILKAAAPNEEWRALSSSEYAKTIHGIVAGAPPAIDLGRRKAADRMPRRSWQASARFFRRTT